MSTFVLCNYPHNYTFYIFHVFYAIWVNCATFMFIKELKNGLSIVHNYIYKYGFYMSVLLTITVYIFWLDSSLRQYRRNNMERIDLLVCIFVTINTGIEQHVTCYLFCLHYQAINSHLTLISNQTMTRLNLSFSFIIVALFWSIPYFCYIAIYMN